MMNDYFLEPSSEFTHPRLRRWRELVGRPGVTATVEVHQPRDLFGAEPATLYVDFQGPGLEIQDRDAWDEELHRGLVKLGVRARTPDDEARRYALALAAAFASVERDVGEGYFSSVLMAQLRESPFAGTLADVGADISTPPPSRTSSRLAETDERIRLIITQHARELIDVLGWKRPDAERILGDALAMYLDERFHVTSRRMLGLATH